MKNLMEEIAASIAVFKAESKLQLEKGNKAAGTRARKESLKLEKLMKQFRKKSLESAQ